MYALKNNADLLKTITFQDKADKKKCMYTVPFLQRYDYQSHETNLGKQGLGEPK